MVIKKWQKDKAVKMRMDGKTYSEILREVRVAKSTLSLWLCDVGLSKPQKQRITKKRLDAAKRGGAKKKQIRVDQTSLIYKNAFKDISKLSKRELWLIGIALYWAEGAKQKTHNISQRLDFGNSDPRMVLLFMTWLRVCLKISKDDIYLSIYIHENNKHRIKQVRRYWCDCIGIENDDIKYIYYKKHNLKTYRKNIGKDYYGLLRIVVKSSTYLNRQVEGWT